MTHDHHDALIDQLLREFLGGDRPRDLTERVLTEARSFDRTRRVWWIQTGAAMAASIAVALTLWTVWPRIFPPKEPFYPVAVVESGKVTISSGGNTPQRGSELETSTETAAIELGGYVDVSMLPSTDMIIGGNKKEEQILLEHGEVQVAVVKKVGTFDVLVGPAKVHVTGTHFDVKVGPESVDPANHRVKTFTVSVTDGSVLVSGADSPTQMLEASQEKTFEIPADVLQIDGATGTGMRINNPSEIPSIQRIKPDVPGPTAAPGVGPEDVSKPIQLIVGAKRDESGTLRLEGDFYLLETLGGNRYALFEKSAAPASLPPVGSGVHVTWDGGKATTVVQVPLLPSPSPPPQGIPGQ